MKKILSFLLVLTLLWGCTRKQPEIQFSSRQISQVLAQMTDIMVHDVTNPPLAARFFSYACLAGYEIVAQNDSSSQSMHGILNKYPKIEKPQISGYSYQLSALLAMMETAKKMQPSGTLVEKYEQRFLDSCRRENISEEVITASLTYAQAISKNVLAYAKADKYNRISNYPRYTPTNQEGAWYPTPPGYFAPVEPYFNTVRSFTLDTCSQFKPAPPVAFSKEKSSEFYKLMQESYQEGVLLPKDHQDIAAFWDCNPFALQDNGHMLVGMKKISPGAHWLGITGIACQQAKVPFAKAMQINTLVAISLMDGFISCWDEKFRSNRIRPETAIRKYIDPRWKPLLQTPPFPEYLSGHSTISSAAAVVLTHYLGDNFKYNDTVEVRFGLPAREFKSFQQAADEAGISRFYGGIHFRDAIDNGRLQGLQVGEWVVNKVNKKANPLVVAEAK
ncbi:vanadium-dependent haloperoxidase [Adhaeribacter radiodurans]|uniref:Vanadium-dependent haloperoxidase n=1 Tax=Adhaeribacter radiodurans TaxID=2745197 RepID=A0A7L7L1T4_9BACT|nr:vanadium-dependent haloperoxidase [Adhaeribacter radiodurans]QMU26742.1 vanadium-dependent haloperoxidase [Adhaeribacter radiodurans]